MLKRIGLYGLALACGAFALSWLELRRFAWAHGVEMLVGLVALMFLALGMFVGFRLAAPRRSPTGAGNPQAQAALGISPREMEVLAALAAGLSNKEIAQQLQVSPNTVKTHAARLFEKLEARRRTEAVARARELGLLA